MIKKGLILIISLMSLNIGAKDIFISDMFDLKVKQFGKNWCWAAVLESVYKHKKQHITQLELVKGYSRREVNDILENKDSIFLGMTMSDFDRLYLKSFNQISLKEVNASLEKNNPVIFIGDSHVMLIVGMSNGFYIIMDPNNDSFQLKRKDQLFNTYINEDKKIKALYYQVI